MTKRGCLKHNKRKQSFQVYKIVSVCLGTPPKEFTFEFYDKDKKYNKIGPISPLNFYTEHVKPHFNVDDKVGNLQESDVRQFSGRRARG